MGEHLSQDLILRGLDDELTAVEQAECSRHLALCEPCRKLTQSWQDFSLQVEAAVQTAPLPDLQGLRDSTRRAVEAQAPQAVQTNPAKVMRRFGWAMALAAVFAIGIVVTPRQEPNVPVTDSPSRRVLSTSTIDVDGESFYALPYSNAELTTAAAQIIQMQVPVSSLADAGIWVEPAARRMTAEDRSVLANVLVGADGQPRGIHVLSFD